MWLRWDLNAPGARSDWRAVLVYRDSDHSTARTREVANQSCLKLAAPSDLRSPARDEAWSILARTCGVSGALGACGMIHSRRRRREQR